MPANSWLHDRWCATRDASWSNLDGLFTQPPMTNLAHFLRCEERYGRGFYPDKQDIFAAFKWPLEDVKVVILGQDPYHDGKATGLAFAIKRSPPKDSLATIFQAVQKDCRRPRCADESLEDWANSGVLLLNTVLTVAKGHAGSHSGLGWEEFTDAAIAEVNAKPERVVFLLWGEKAARVEGRVANHHFVPEPAQHPASRGKTGKRPKLIDAGHFSQATTALGPARAICW